MDEDTVFKHNSSANYKVIHKNSKLIKAFLAIDGKSSIKTIASTNNYEIDDLISMVDQIEKMGLIIPVDGAKLKGIETVAESHHGTRTYLFRGARLEEVD